MKAFSLEVLLTLLASLLQQAKSGGSQEYYMTFCNTYVDIYDSAKRYQGSSCFLGISASWSDAKLICEANNMYLTKILNTAIQNSIFDTATKIHGTKQLTSIWINTQKDETGSWWSYEGSYKYKLMAPARLGWANTAAQQLGNCMMLTNQNGNFRLSSADCDLKNPFICSFNRTLS